MKKASEKRCPKCGRTVFPMMFMGAVPDGYVCSACKLYLTDELVPLATII
jgi:DNA-directed RNA polymerase subunit RPC12/RpoP